MTLSGGTDSVTRPPYALPQSADSEDQKASCGVLAADSASPAERDSQAMASDTITAEQREGIRMAETATLHVGAPCRAVNVSGRHEGFGLR